MHTVISSLRRPLWYSAGLILVFNGVFLAWILIKPGTPDLFIAVADGFQASGSLLMVLLCFYGLGRLYRQGKSRPDTAPTLRTGRQWVPILLTLSVLSEAIGQGIW